jgi:hypothetical protein
MAEHPEPQHPAPEKTAEKPAVATRTAPALRELHHAPLEEVAATHTDAAELQQRYIASRLYTEGFGLHGRQADAIGLWGDGSTYVGNGLIVDVDTLEVVQAFDGALFTGGSVYANSRDIPAALLEALIEGGTPPAARSRKPDARGGKDAAQEVRQ